MRTPTIIKSNLGHLPIFLRRLNVFLPRRHLVARFLPTQGGSIPHQLGNRFPEIYFTCFVFLLFLERKLVIKGSMGIGPSAKSRMI